MANHVWLSDSMEHNLAWDWLLVVPVEETCLYRHLKTNQFTCKNPQLVPAWATPYVRLHLPNGLSSSSAPTEERYSLLTPARILQSRLSLMTSKNYEAQYYAFLPSSFTLVQAQIFSSAYLSLTQSILLIWVSFISMHNRQIYKENNLNEMSVNIPQNSSVLYLRVNAFLHGTFWASFTPIHNR
jgi:hypothetical protein